MHPDVHAGRSSGNLQHTRSGGAHQTEGRGGACGGSGA